jgi:tetratricopeptide (TPR) repeat protein
MLAQRFGPCYFVCLTTCRAARRSTDMAYVRRKGNQLAVVHGVRDPETRNVEQKTLFTLYSKAEALAAIGDKSYHFRSILEHDHPGLRLDWTKLEAEIRGNLEHLPDLYTYKKERVEDGFRTALIGFARELMLTDPQVLVSSARLIEAHRHELVHLRDLIDWRLQTCDSKEEHEFNRDNPFFWRAMSHRKAVPGEEWEKLGTLYERGRYEEAEAIARMLTECWPNFAEGFNYLGLIAMEREDYEAAIEFFDEATRVGRTLFPKRIRKSLWWNDHDTRPYIRSLIYKAQALNRTADYVGALVLCNRLESECHQDIAAASEKTAIFLNDGQWESARDAARYVSSIYPRHNFSLAFAHFELGDRQEALVWFLRAAVEYPRAAHMLLGLETSEPTCIDEARDHDAGVAMIRDLDAYLTLSSEGAERFFTSALESEPVRAALAEYQHARKKWLKEHDRTWFQKMNEMRTEEYARRTAALVAPHVGRSPSPTA